MDSLIRTEQPRYLIHPYIRLIILLVTLIGIFTCTNIILLTLLYFTIFIPIYIIENQIYNHLRLILIGIVPIFLSFILIYIIIYEKRLGSWDFIFLKSFKLLMLTSLFQIILNIPKSALVQTLKAYKFKSNSIIIVLGTYTVWQDIIVKTNLIISSRLSRGFIKKRTPLNMIWQFPPTMLPLVINILRSAIVRSEAWSQKNVLRLIEIYEPTRIQYNYIYNSWLFCTACIWLSLTIIFK